MNITLITPGKIKHQFYSKAEQEYLQRIEKFCEMKLIETKEEPFRKSTNLAVARENEAVKIREKIPSGAQLICLDETGKNFTSKEFASFLGKLELSGKNVVFVIGGTCGIAESLKNDSAAIFSLGKMTMSQDLARVAFLEQLFRAFTIIKGIPFHR